MTDAAPATAEPNIVKRALAGHASIGLLAGALIYLIALTGCMIVVHERWQRWEQPNIAEAPALSPAAAQASLAPVLEREQGLPKTAHLFVRMPTHDLPRAVVTTDNKAWYVDGEGRVAGREAHTWTEFVMALHINLTLPIVWGMILVGALGVALAALLVTGVLAHPRIVKDAFRLRIRHDPQLARADWHNRLGVWTLPFTLAVTLTGAFIGLSYAGVGALAGGFDHERTDAVYAKIFGEEPAHDATPAPLPNIARALETVQARFPDTFPTYVVVHDPMTRGHFVQIIAEHPRRLVYGESYSFDGAGNYLGKVGITDGEIGRQAFGSTYKLHFGDFAGLPVELAYILFGLALCVITATGTTLWLRKRERKGHDSRRLAACWTVVVWGIPMALVATAWLRGIGGPDVPLVAAFWITMALALAFAAFRPAFVTETRLRNLLAVSLLVTALAHWVAFQPQEAGVLALDAVLVLAAALVWKRRAARTSQLERERAAPSGTALTSKPF
ncbi:MAG TPA: PepSY-associated TM helix domain-containing protein [Qipengyuania sp.]|nr:PepSY-associated TM helix domain-containing protein [Qipengyuania sp.]